MYISKNTNCKKPIINKLNNMTVDKQKTIPPPDGGYGWVVVIAAFCCFNLIGTHLMAFGLLYRPVVDEYGTSYALAGFVGSISLAFAQLPGKL